MTKSPLSGKAQSVLGLVDSKDLGITLPHEHLFIDIRFLMAEPPDNEGKKLCHEKVTMENLWFVRRNILSHADNMVLDDEETAIREVEFFKKAKGKTIVDVTPIGVGGKPTALVNVSKATGVNVIMGTAYYIAASYTPEMRIESKTEKDIAEEFIRAIKVGIAENEIKAGVIGEIGCSWPMTTGEQKVMRAAGIAQVETGAAINIHPGPDEECPFQCIQILKEVGTDISRVCFSHMTRTFSPEAQEARFRLAESGCCLVYDWFGREGLRPVSLVSKKVLVNDVTRIAQIKQLIKEGFVKQIMISHDVCFKIMLQAYGGSGFSWIPTITVPEMRQSGMTEDQINTILIENPARIIPFA